MINPDDILVPCKGFAVRELGDEIIFIAEEGDEMHTLDEIGSSIWRNIDGKCSVMSILDSICKEYSVERSIAERDLIRFIEELMQKKILIIRK